MLAVVVTAEEAVVVVGGACCWWRAPPVVVCMRDWSEFKVEVLPTCDVEVIVVGALVCILVITVRSGTIGMVGMVVC